MGYIDPFGTLSRIPNHYLAKVVSASELLGANSTPVVIVPAVPGKVVIPRYIFMNKAAGVAYDPNGNTNLKFQTESLTIFNILNFTIAGFLDQTVATFFGFMYSGPFGFNDTNLDPAVGNKLQIWLDTADMPTGDGDLTVEVVYEEVPFTFI